MNTIPIITPIQGRKRTEKPHPCNVGGCGRPATHTHWLEDGRMLFHLCKVCSNAYKLEMMSK